MTNEPDDQILPRIEDCAVALISHDPLVGIMRLSTSAGQFDLAINKNAATLIALALVDFLGTEPADEDQVSDMH